MKTDNELIAEFMGILKVSSKKYLNSPTYCHPVWGDTDKTGLHYHSSWDWLMPVVEKIDSMGDSDPSIYDSDELHTLMELPIKTSIRRVYGHVIVFIKWYNENKTI